MRRHLFPLTSLYLPALLLVGFSWPKVPARSGPAVSIAHPHHVVEVKALVSEPGLTPASEPPGNSTDWVLTFNDEFNGASLDLTKWSTKYAFDTGHGDRSNNDEQEWYVDDAHTVGSGVLTITTKRECLANNRLENYPPYNCVTYPYTSGIISSQDSFAQKYGYFEVRMKIPAGQGFWPAFWLLAQPSPLPASTPWPNSAVFWPPEIDVMENKGSDLSVIYMTNHYSAYYPIPGNEENNWAWGGIHGDNTQGDTADYSQDFHTYGVDWEPDQIVWYVDGIERYRTTQHVPPGSLIPGKMYVLANLAVGGAFPGSPDVSTVFPNTLQIDYVRIYQRTASMPYRAFIASVNN